MEPMCFYLERTHLEAQSFASIPVFETQVSSEWLEDELL